MNFMLCYKLAALQDFTESFSSLYLTSVRTHLLNAIHERFNSAVISIQRNCANQICSFGNPKRVKYGKNAICTHELSSVKQGQALLAHKFNRLPSKLFKNIFCCAAFSFVINIPLSNQRHKQICKRS